MCYKSCLFLCLQRILSEILNKKLAHNTVFCEISMVFHAKNVNEIIASITVEQGSIIESVSCEVTTLKNNLRFTQQYTDLLITSRNLSEKSLMDF